jgi:GxxExxY protein
MDEDEIGTMVVETATEIHKELGPGLLETVYEIVLSKELQAKGLKIIRQVPIPINYKGIKFDEGFRADMIVDEKVILELKSIAMINNAHKKQLLTYLKLSNMKLGYLLNFGADLMKNGITRTVNGLSSPENY